MLSRAVAVVFRPADPPSRRIRQRAKTPLPPSPVRRPPPYVQTIFCSFFIHSLRQCLTPRPHRRNCAQRGFLTTRHKFASPTQRGSTYFPSAPAVGSCTDLISVCNLQVTCVTSYSQEANNKMCVGDVRQKHSCLSI